MSPNSTLLAGVVVVVVDVAVSLDNKFIVVNLKTQTEEDKS